MKITKIGNQGTIERASCGKASKTLKKIKNNVAVNTSGDSVDTAVNIATICRLIDKQCKLYYLTCEDRCVAGGCGAMLQLQL